MHRLFASLLAMITLVALPSCGGDDDAPSDTSLAPEASTEDTALSPEQTLARLLELAKADDWETYVDDFYGESHKFEGIAERREAVIARFRDKWAAMTIEGFEALDKVNATISDDGKKAVFTKDGKPSFNVFLSDDGRWTFHL